MQWLIMYKNLRIGLGVIACITYLISHVYYDFPFGSMMDMQVLMGVRFLVFGIMKLADINGFAMMFSQYDPLAKNIRGYGLIYPFLEILLGGLYLRDITMVYTIPINIITIIITTITSLGIIISIKSRSQIHCACMGTGAMIPLGRPSLIEQVGMCLMAIYMILMMM